MQVWDNDQFNADDFMGAIMVPLFAAPHFHQEAWYRLGTGKICRDSLLALDAPFLYLLLHAPRPRATRLVHTIFFVLYIIVPLVRKIDSRERYDNV
jgi:hypothetical protein